MEERRSGTKLTSERDRLGEIMKTRILLPLLVFVVSVPALAQGSYMKPPQEILDVLNAPPIPSTSVSPSGDKIAMLTLLRYPPIADLAQPMLRLAGERVN